MRPRRLTAARASLSQALKLESDAEFNAITLEAFIVVGTTLWAMATRPHPRWQLGVAAVCLGAMAGARRVIDLRSLPTRLRRRLSPTLTRRSRSAFSSCGCVQ